MDKETVLFWNCGNVNVRYASFWREFNREVSLMGKQRKDGIFLGRNNVRTNTDRNVYRWNLDTLTA